METGSSEREMEIGLWNEGLGSRGVVDGVNDGVGFRGDS